MLKKINYKNTKIVRYATNKKAHYYCWISYISINLDPDPLTDNPFLSTFLHISQY